MNMAPNSDDHNKDELEAPEWLNAEFFTRVLRECEKDPQIQVKHVQITPASLKGDHYASVMFRATIRYEQRQTEHTKPLIIKTMPELQGLKKELLQDSHIFETENAIYSEVIPRFERILRSVGDDTVLAPRCLYHSLAPKKLIIFEDIVPLGYTVLRDRQATLTEAKAAYLKLAKFHAISYKLALEEPNYFDQYRHGFFTISQMVNGDFIRDGIGNFIEMLDEIPTLRQYKRYFDPMAKTLIDTAKASFTEYRENRQENESYVLCHGDFHCKNMMFKIDPQTQVLRDVLLHDFQISYMGPQVMDVIYSIYMLMDMEMHENHLDELLHYYFSNFVDTLEKIGYEGRIPKLREFRQQLVEHRHFEIFLLVTFLPMWYGMREGAADPDEMIESQDCRKSLYRHKDFIEDMHKILPRYLHIGYLD